MSTEDTEMKDNGNKTESEDIENSNTENVNDSVENKNSNIENSDKNTESLDKTIEIDIEMSDLMALKESIKVKEGVAWSTVPVHRAGGSHKTYLFWIAFVEKDDTIELLGDQLHSEEFAKVFKNPMFGANAKKYKEKHKLDFDQEIYDKLFAGIIEIDEVRGWIKKRILNIGEAFDTFPFLKHGYLFLVTLSEAAQASVGYTSFTIRGKQ